MRRFLMVLAVAGCAMPQAAAVPEAARLSDRVLVVVLSDGTTCRAAWRDAHGAGRMADCGAGFDYRVTEVDRPNLLRQLFVDVTGALGMAGAVPPMAEVVISGGGREWRFVSPPPAG